MNAKFFTRKIGCEHSTYGEGKKAAVFQVIPNEALIRL